MLRNIVWLALVTCAAIAVEPVPSAPPCDKPSLIELALGVRGARVDSQTYPEFAPVREFLTGNAKDWYSLSIPLNPLKIDPYFVEVAKLTGGTAFYGGGSDLIDLALVQGPKAASMGETNVIRPLGMYERQEVEKQWTQNEVDVPAWQGRRTPIRYTSINGESGMDLMLMVKNATEGKHLTQGNPFINVPFKHGHIATVNAKGEGRLYFRTPRDFTNWQNKILTLPEEDTFPADLVKKYSDRASQATQARLLLSYGLIVYARVKPQGWKFSPKSAAILKAWVEDYGTDIAEAVKREVYGNAARQDVSPATVGEVLREFGIR